MYTEQKYHPGIEKTGQILHKHPENVLSVPCLLVIERAEIDCGVPRWITSSCGNEWTRKASAFCPLAEFIVLIRLKGFIPESPGCD